MATWLRMLCLAVLGVVGTAAIGAAGPLTIRAQLTATTALIMGGTGHPLVGESAGFVDEFVRDALDLYIAPTGSVRADPHGVYNLVAVQTPEQFWPVIGPEKFDRSVAVGVRNLDNCVQGRVSCKAHYVDGDVAPTPDIVTFGYSQSARIATIEKRNLIAQYRTQDGSWDPVVDSNLADLHASFVLVANPNRPNGGILARFAGLHMSVLGVTFDGATPTDSCDADGANCRFPTTDIAWQYDGWADFPRQPLNLLADLNALAGIVYLHQNYTVPVTEAMYQGGTGDTSYYLLAAERLPLLMPLAQLGVPAPILDILDAPLRVIVEWGYDRGINPGDPTPATLTDPRDPMTKIRNLLAAIPVGLDDGMQEVGLGRPLGTTPAGPFGVGVASPPAERPPSAATTVARPPRSPRPQGAAGGGPRTRPGLDRARHGYVGGHGQVDRRNVSGHSRSRRGG